MFKNIWKKIWQRLILGALEEALEEGLNYIQDEIAAKLEKDYKIPRAVFAEVFWSFVDKYDDKIGMELEDETPGK